MKHMTGFTLLELIVVLVILGLGASVAMPSLVRLVDSLDEEQHENSVIVYLRALPVRTMEDIESFNINRTEGFKPATRILSKSPEPLPEHFQSLKVWVQEPVTWRANGACTGGLLRWQFANQTPFTIQLEAPRCQPQRT